MGLGERAKRGLGKLNPGLVGLLWLLVSVLLASGAQAIPPPNDEFANATVVTGFPTGVAGTNVDATKEPFELNHTSNPGGRSVWYRWTAPQNGVVQIFTCGFTDFDTLLAVYTGNALIGLVTIAGNNDTNGCLLTDGSVHGSRVQFSATAGTVYRIAVDGFNNGTSGAAAGNFVLSIDRLPPNDGFPGESLSGTLPIDTSQSNVGASKEAGEPAHAGNGGGHSLWYSWTSITSGPVQINTCSTSNTIDTLLAVYTGTAVTGLSAVAQNDNTAACGTGGHGSRVQFTATGGTTYRIAVDGRSGLTGSVRMQITGSPPTNNDFASAQVLSGVGVSVNASNAGATAEVGEPTHGTPTQAAASSVWYAWTAAVTGPVHIDTCIGTSFDTRIGVYTGNTVNSLVAVATNDDDPTCGTGSVVDFHATAGTTYRIAVDGYAGAVGVFVLRLRVAADATTTTTTMPATTTTTTPATTTTLPASGGTPTTTTMPTGAAPTTTTMAPAPTTTTTMPAGGVPTTTLPPPSAPCDAFADLARARCLIDEVLAGILCQDSMGRRFERSLRRGLAGVSVKLSRAMLSSGRKRAKLVAQVRIGLRRVGKHVATEGATPRPPLSTACSARLLNVVAAAQSAVGP
jgi:hypothetical protein